MEGASFRSRPCPGANCQDRGPLRSATGGVDAARLARYAAAQLGTLPRYPQKLAFAPLSGRPVWVDDPHFDLDDHLRHAALQPPAVSRT
jgi:hypothetical protein